MTGVSYVIPFVAAGGLLIALSFALGGYEITDAPKVTERFDWGSLQSWAALMFQIGGIAFGFLVPILAGFIAFAMGDRPALVPGIVGGFIAVEVQAGFLGGLDRRPAGRCRRAGDSQGEGASRRSPASCRWW